MKTAERTRIAFERGMPDRVPFHCWLGLPLIKELTPADKRMYEMLEWWIDDPMGSIVKMQKDLGLDPMITTYSPAHRRARDLAAHALPAAVRDRHVGRDVRGAAPRARAGASTRTRSARPTATSTTRTAPRTASAPPATTSCSKGDEPEKQARRAEALPVTPTSTTCRVMKGMVEKVGDEAWWLHHVIGPWDMAAEIRGLVDLSMDIYDRPQFVHDLMRVCTDWLKLVLPAPRRDRHPLDLHERDLGRRRRVAASTTASS